MTVKKSPLTEALKDFDATNLEQGNCSVRVQKIINVIHGRKDETATEVSVGDPVTELGSTDRLFPLTESNEGWRLVARESGEPGSVRQDIYFAKANLRGEWKGVPVFTLLERANDDGCSVALCLPATLDNLEWSVVATKADETRAVTIDESLKKIPQTNAKILNMLFGSLKERQTNPELIEPLHIDNLFERAFPTEIEKADTEFATLVPETRRERLAKEMARVGIFSVLARQPIDFKSDISTTEHLRFSQLDERVASVERVITDRGTTPKVFQLGHVVLANESTPVFVPKDGLEKLIDDSAAEEILAHAEDAHNIPETISSPELTKAINDMISHLITNVPSAQHDGEFNKRLAEILVTHLPLIRKRISDDRTESEKDTPLQVTGISQSLSEMEPQVRERILRDALILVRESDDRTESEKDTPLQVTDISQSLSEMEPQERERIYRDALLIVREAMDNSKVSQIDIYNNDNVVLQIGNIDIRRLGSGDYLKGSPFLDWEGNISVHINATRAQEVLGEISTPLYDCSVDGASRAFVRINGGKKLVAKNCFEVFTDSSRPIEDSIALNCGLAFYNVDVHDCPVSNCIAESCDEAFHYVSAQNSIALNCKSAFTRLWDSHNLTAEYCDGAKGRLFTDSSGFRNLGYWRTRSDLVARDVTGGFYGSLISNYRAGKRFGQPTGCRLTQK